MTETVANIAPGAFDECDAPILSAPKDSYVQRYAEENGLEREELWAVITPGFTPELKALADYVTTDVDKDGIYNACLALGLFDA